MDCRFPDETGNIQSTSRKNRLKCFLVIFPPKADVNFTVSSGNRETIINILLILSTKNIKKRIHSIFSFKE